VINFVNESNQLLSIVGSDIGSGPVNIVIDGLDFSRCSSVVITSSILHLDDFEIIFDKNSKYNSTVIYQNIDLLVLIENLDTFHEFLCSLALPNSLIHLLKSHIDSNKQSNFRNRLFKQMNEGSTSYSVKIL